MLTSASYKLKDSVAMVGETGSGRIFCMPFGTVGGVEPLMNPDNDVINSKYKQAWVYAMEYTSDGHVSKDKITPTDLPQCRNSARAK